MTPSSDQLQADWRRLSDAFALYLRMEKGLSDNSVSAYLNDLRHLTDYALELQKQPQQLTVGDMQDLIADMNDTGIAVATQCRLISGWRMFYQMLVLEDEMSENPAKLLVMPMRPQHLPDVLTDDDVAAIQATFDRSLPDQDRNYVIVEVLYGCGLRVSELVNMRLSNIYDEEEFLLITGKGDKQRWVPINSRALALLLDYIRLTRSQIAPKPGEERYVFLNRRGCHLSRNFVFMFLKKAASDAGIEKHVSPHSLRHTFATELVRNGADLRAVQEMLGHASLSTTEIYTHLDTHFLRETIACYHPHYCKM
ncbi:MAG: tyrosine-type recombinase/integrase [Bacteroidales bacterium]|nr:tyrosine-type recombinase/integrase [Bacteroidales bacterium]